MKTDIVDAPPKSTPCMEAPTAAAHDETGARMQTGAAVESMIHASFAREILCLSLKGLITVPTKRQLK